jgi:copper chaperone
MNKLTEKLEIEGMTCGGCVRHVRTALVAMDGVEVSDISIGEAEIAYDPARVTRDDIVATIREEGYAVR